MPETCSDLVCAMDDFACIQKRIFEPIQKNSLYKHILASSVGSIVSTVALNPIAVVKVKIQNVNPFAISQTVSHTIQNIIKEKGLIGFYAGTPMGIMMSVPNTVLYMTAYEEVKVMLNRKVNNPNLNHLIPGLAGACARMFAVSITTPLELIRTIQTGGVNKSIVQIAKEIVENRGYAGLYGGWSSTVMRDCPFSAIYWYVFEVIRPKYSLLFSEQPAAFNSNGADGKAKSGEFSVFATFLSGATAGMLAALCTHPYDVIKTQQQMAVMNKNDTAVTTSSTTDRASQVMSKLRGASSHLHTDSLISTSHGSTVMVNCHSTQLYHIENSKATALSSMANEFVASVDKSQPLERLKTAASSQQISLRYLYTNGGVSALYRGLSMRLVSVIPASAIMVTIYEKIKSIEF